MTIGAVAPVRISWPPMTRGTSIVSPAIAASFAWIDARSGVPGAYDRIGSLTGGGTRRWPLKLACDGMGVLARSATSLRVARWGRRWEQRFVQKGDEWRDA